MPSEITFTPGTERVRVAYDNRVSKVVVSDFETHKTALVTELQSGTPTTQDDLFGVRVVRQSPSVGACVVDSSSEPLLPVHARVLYVKINGEPVQLDTSRLGDSFILNDDALGMSPADDASFELISPDVSPLPFKWGHVKTLRVVLVSSAKSSRGLIVTRSAYPRTLPAGSVIIRLAGPAGVFPAAPSQTLGNQPRLVAAFAQALADLKPRATGGKVQMWQAAAAMPLSALADRLGLGTAATNAPWVLHVSQPSRIYAAGVRLGDTVLRVNDVPIAQTKAGERQFMAHAADEIRTMQTVRSTARGRATEEHDKRVAEGRRMSYGVLGVWAKGDELTGSPSVQESRRARAVLHRHWQLVDTGTSGAGVRALKAAYGRAVLGMCASDPNLAKSVIPSTILFYAPLALARASYADGSSPNVDYRLSVAHKVLLAILQVAIRAPTSPNEPRVRLHPLSNFTQALPKRLPLYRHLLHTVMQLMSPVGDRAESNPLPLHVTIEYGRYDTDSGRTSVALGARVFTVADGALVTYAKLHGAHPALVEAMLRRGEEPARRPGAVRTSKAAAALGLMTASFGAPSAATREQAIAHALARNKVVWGEKLYKAVAQALVGGRANTQDAEYERFSSLLAAHLSVAENGPVFVDKRSIYYKRTTSLSAPSAGAAVPMQFMDNQARLRQPLLLVVPEANKRAILDRLYVHGRGHDDAKDAMPLTKADAEASTRATHKMGESGHMVGMGINKMEAVVRARYWGITRKDIARYLRNREERQLRAPPVRRSGTVRDALAVGDVVRVLTTAGITFFRHQDTDDDKDKYRRYKQLASEQLKGKSTAPADRYSSRLYKVSARYDTLERATPTEQACREWQGDSSFFGTGHNFDWWPSSKHVPVGASNRLVCMGYTAFVDVYTKYAWLEPLDAKKTKVEGEYRSPRAATLRAAKQCFSAAVGWCKREYTLSPVQQRSVGGPDLLGGGHGSNDWAPTNVQTDNGTEYSAASAKRPLDERGEVITQTDMEVNTRSQFADRLSDFQRHVYKEGGRMHSTSKPEISFRQQGAIEILHAALKSLAHDITRADPRRYGVKKLANNLKLQHEVLQLACTKYNDSPHRSLPQTAEVQGLTPLRLMRYMLKHHGDKTQAGVWDTMKSSIRQHRDRLRERTTSTFADLARYTIVPVTAADYVSAGWERADLPRKSAYAGEHMHGPHARFGRHELLRVDLAAMQPMDKDQQKVKSPRRERLEGRVAVGSLGGSTEEPRLVERRYTPARASKTNAEQALEPKMTPAERRARAREGKRAAALAAEAGTEEDTDSEGDYLVRDEAGSASDDDDEEQELVLSAEQETAAALGQIAALIKGAQAAGDIVAIKGRMNAIADSVPTVKGTGAWADVGQALDTKMLQVAAPRKPKQPKPKKKKKARKSESSNAAPRRMSRRRRRK